MDILKGSAVSALCFFMVESADHITGLTGASPTVTISKNGGTFASPAGTVTEIANGWYKVAANATDSDTAGPLLLHATATSGDPADVVVANVVDPTVAGVGVNLVNIAGSAVSTSSAQLGVNAVNIGGTAQTGRDLGTSVLLSSGTGTGQVSLASGAVTVGTNNDKTGYTASTVSDKTGYALTAAYDAAKTAAQAGDQMDLVNAPNATAVTAVQSGLSTLTAANVKTQVVAALDTDTYAEPGQEAPAATNTLAAKIGYLFKAFRNKITQDSSTVEIFNDGGTVVDQKATVSASGTTFTRGEIGTGP